MFTLVWLFLVMTPQGPAPAQIQDATKFKTMAACQAFAEKMTPRAQDWIRGAVKGAWEMEVHSKFQCTKDGEPA